MRMNDRIGLTSLTTAPTFPRSAGRPAARKFRTPLLEILVITALLLVVVPTLILTARHQVSAANSQVVLGVNSDPSGASVIVDDLWVGRTPMQVELQRDEPFSLRVVAREPYLEYDLYKPYRAEMTLAGDRNIQVWIPRTTAEEQAAQIAGRND